MLLRTPGLGGSGTGSALVTPSGGDDTAAIQAQYDALKAAGGGILELGAGTFIFDSSATGLTWDSGLVELRGQGDSTILQAGAAATTSVLNITIPGAGRGRFSDFIVDGAGIAKNPIVQSIASETSVGTRFDRVKAQNASSGNFQWVNTGCEDCTYFDCSTPGDEGNTTGIAPAISVSVPNGNVRFIDGEFFGECLLEYQVALVVGTTLGPINIANPSGSIESVLVLDGAYVYDGGSLSGSCITTATNLTSIVANGTLFSAQVQPHFIGGNMPPGCGIELNHCIFYCNQANTVYYLLYGSGQLALTVKGGAASVASGSALGALDSVAGTAYCRLVETMTNLAVPSSALSAPAVPASGTAATNTSPFPAMVYVEGGTVTGVAIGGTATGKTSGAFRLKPGESIALTYSAAPTWTWFSE